MGGIVGRREATGKGVVQTVLAMCHKLGVDIKDMRVAIQGFGNVGSISAVEVVKHGAKVVAVADICGGVAKPEGLDIEALMQHVKKKGCVKGFKGATAFDRRQDFRY